jgi:hypothetical protein
MANPFSSIGISDRDYKAAVAAIAGEMGATAQQDDVDRILDSIANRAQKGNRTLGQVVTARGQYDAMRGIAGNRDRGNRRTNGGQKIAREAFRTALAPSRAAPAVRDRIAKANQAIENVMETGWSRGIAQGATDYRHVQQTDKWGTGKGHRTKEARYGYLDDDTGHRFTGTGMWQGRTYDPVSLHGMLTPPDTPPPVDIPVYGPPMPGGYAPAPRDAYTVQPQGLARETFDQIYEAGAMPAREPPATFDERYAPSGPMPPGSFGDFLGSYGTDHLIGSEQPASAGFFNDRFAGDGLPMNSAAFGRPIGDYEFGSQAAPMTGPASMAYGLNFETAPDPFAPTAAPDWFNDRLAEPSLYGSGFGLDTAMAGSRTTPVANSGVIGSEITPEYAPFVSEASQQILDSFPDYDHLGAPPMGGYTPPAPPQDYTVPPSMLAGMDIGGSTADRLRSPSGYGSDYMTPGYARDPMEGARERLTAGLAERFGATAAAAIPQAPPQAPPRAPDPVSRFTERTVYDTKVVPEKYTVDVPVERSFSKANVGPALGAKPTGFADLGFMSGLMTGNPWSDSLHEKAKEVGKPFKGINDIGPLPGLTRREERTRDKIVSTPRIERTPIERAPIAPTPTRPAMARPEVPSFTRPMPMQDLGINPIGKGSWGFDTSSWGFNAFEPPAPSLSQGFAMAGNSLLGGLSDSLLSGLGYGPDSSFTGGWGMGWGEGGPGGYGLDSGRGSVYDGSSGPYSGGDARFDGGWGGLADSDTYR